MKLHRILTCLLALAVWASCTAAFAVATLTVNAARRTANPIPKNITGKFAEHLGNNIYNGMDAQILRNPTFADFPFWTRNMNPDGLAKFFYEPEKIAREIKMSAVQMGWPAAATDRIARDYQDGLACLWTRIGDHRSVQVSPDTAPFGLRAQRIEIKAASQGIGQWDYLPLHRTRKFEFEIFLRSPNLSSFTVTLAPGEGAEGGATAKVEGVANDWKKFTGTLELGPEIPAETPCRFAITAGGAGQFVIGRAMLRPADHIGGADPDIVRLLKASHLPLLRWPGGNFVSTYHWRDGVGPVETRPTLPNYAWGGVEPNLFGTDEFVAFCRAVGCEPMICVNGGSGTPGEAADWIEYCNGSAVTPMGKLRAANGHPEPYNIKLWEVGNELWGRWQFHWTTPTGYVDRYRQFSRAMLKADPTIRLMACGAPVMSKREWNHTLIAGLGADFSTITDHPLIGGAVSSNMNPLDIYRDFMAIPEVQQKKWDAVRREMIAAGVKEPHLAVTELQMFAKLPRNAAPTPGARLTSATLVSPGTLGEALYDVLYYHSALRLAPFVDIFTHSAIVNHGGGMRKDRERVYVHPCYYAQASFAELAGAMPVASDVTAPEEKAPRVLSGLRGAAGEASYRTVAALAAIAPDGDLLISIVHRAAAGSTRLNIRLQDFSAGQVAQVHTLSAPVPWATNSLAQPDAVKPVDSTVAVKDNRLTLELKPYSVLVVRVPKA